MAENAQSKRSKKWISDALTELMRKKPFDEITVKDITDKAGVARLTFYRHFETKEEVLNYRFQELFSEYLSTLENTEAKNLLEALTICFTYWKKNTTQIITLKENGLSWSITFSHILGRSSFNWSIISSKEPFSKLNARLPVLNVLR